MIERLESGTPLAQAFNKIARQLDTVKILTHPRSFQDLRGEQGQFITTTYYETLLWELWLNGVEERLRHWVTAIDSYFNDYEGSWEYYALSKRIESIREFGSDDDADYNPDGTIKTEGITRQQLRHYTIASWELWQDAVDIVQDTRLEDLGTLLRALQTNAVLTPKEMIRQSFGANIDTYVHDEQGNLRPTTFAEDELDKANRRVTADDSDELILMVSHIVQCLVLEIQQMKDSDDIIFTGNHAQLAAIRSDAQALLDMKFDKTRTVQRIKSSSK